MKYILFTGGGSAGHVVPNLALMNELKYSHRLAYMGTDGIEKGLVEEKGYEFIQVNTPKLVRGISFNNLKIPIRLARAVKQAEELFQSDPPDLVFSKGGYASYPAAKAAIKLKIPLLTHESDLSAGLCTKLLAKGATRVLTSFEDTAEKFQNGLYVGSPMRKEIFGGDRMRALRKYDLSDEKPVLLALGGGSGSRALNEFVRNNLTSLLNRFQILHLCGKGNTVQISRAGYVQKEFETDMGSAYALSDVVLARAGSNTIFELLALKKPCLLVPLMKGSRGDQVENAAYFSVRGLCRTLTERELNECGVKELWSTYSDRKLQERLQKAQIRSGNERILPIVKQLAQRSF